MRKLSNIYLFDKNTGAYKLTKGQLDIRYRLFIEFYLKCSGAKELNPKNNYLWVADYEDVLEELEEKYKISSYPISKKKNLLEYLQISCEAARKVYREKKRFELGMQNIRDAIQLYNASSKEKTISEEESFNAVFSEGCIKWLLNIMQEHEGYLPLCIAPLRIQLCEKNQGGRTINNKTWKWCFEKDYRLSIDELKKEIECKMYFSKISNQFCLISKQLKKVRLKKVENDICD